MEGGKTEKHDLNSVATKFARNFMKFGIPECDASEDGLKFKTDLVEIGNALRDNHFDEESYIRGIQIAAIVEHGGNSRYAAAVALVEICRVLGRDVL